MASCNFRSNTIKLIIGVVLISVSVFIAYNLFGHSLLKYTCNFITEKIFKNAPSIQDNLFLDEYYKKFDICNLSLLFSCLAFVGLLLFYSRKPYDDFLSLVLKALITLALFFVAIMISIFILLILLSPYSSDYLAWPFSIVNHYSFYIGLECGPLIYRTYPPLSTILYLPSTLLNRPVPALVMGSVISSILFFLPVLYLFIRNDRSQSVREFFRLYGFVLFGLLVCITRSLSDCAFRIAPDPSMLGVSVIAFSAIYFRKDKKSILPFFWASIFSVLAVWAKQIALLLLFVLPFYVFLTDGIKNFMRFIGLQFITAIVVSFPFVYAFGYKNLFLNLIMIPSRHHIGTFSHILSEYGWGIVHVLINNSLLILLLIVLIAQSARRDRAISGKAADLRVWLDSNRWLIFVMAGFFMMPMAALGILKRGGGLNSLGYSIFFVAIAICLRLVQMATSATGANALIGQKNTQWFFIVVLILPMLFVMPKFWVAGTLPHVLSRNDNEAAYRYGKRHLNNVYYPANPLVCLITEGRLYHTLSGIREREWAGIYLDDECFKAHIPSKLEQVAFPPISEPEEITTYMQVYLSEFTKRVEVPELKGWIVYEKPVR